MEKKYTVQEFVDKYNSFNNTTLKDEFVSGVIVSDYIGTVEKMVRARNIVNSTTMTDGKFDNSSIIRYVHTMLTLIDMYTNISIDFKKAHLEFDLLDSIIIPVEEHEFSMLDKLIQIIPEKERATFETYVKMTFDDFMINRAENHDAVMEIILGITGALSSTFEKYIPVLDEFLEKLPNEVTE